VAKEIIEIQRKANKKHLEMALNQITRKMKVTEANFIKMYNKSIADETFLNKVIEDIHNARSKCFRPKGTPAPQPSWILLKQIDDYFEQEFFHNQTNFTNLHNENSVRLAIIKDMIYLKFGTEDEDLFYLLDVYRKKKIYQD